MSADEPARSRPLKGAWPGVLLSPLVPGFGLVRAGRIARGVTWFVAIQIVAILVTLLFIWRAIPFWAALCGFIAAIAFQVVMLVDSFRSGGLTTIGSLAFALVLAAILLFPLPPRFIAEVFKIPTAAMEPTLQGPSRGTPDHVIVDRLSYWFSPPQRGDLAVFRTTGIAGISGEGPSFVKRVIGLPGERIEIRDGHLFADGRQLNENDGIPTMLFYSVPTSLPHSFNSDGIYLVPDDAYFVLGDNSRNSFDSRYWGYVPRTNIYGRVSRVYYPFSHASIPRWRVGI
jgi:signal peptidase I